MVFSLYRLILCGVLFGPYLFAASVYAEPTSLQAQPNIEQQLQHAGAITAQVAISEYLVSEKFDGVRGFWSGSAMYSRSGRPINLPTWFTDGFPDEPLDGELWIGHGRFDEISALVRQSDPDESDWRKVKFMVFDVPQLALPFAMRYGYAQEQFADISPYLVVIVQLQFTNALALDDHLGQVIKEGGEGLMLHRKSALYHQGRNHDLVKLKRYEDAEAEVVGYHQGKGKYLGMLGALEVETPSGIRFKLGSGLSDAERQNPPPLGTVVTYKFYGLTSNGVPRFASFMRVRPSQ